MSKIFIKKGLPLLCVMVLLSLCAVTSVFAQAPHWADGPLQKWRDYGILGGYEDGDLKPDNSLTRAEAAKIISGLISAQNYPAAKTFADVNPGNWYYASVHNVVAAGVMVGVGDTVFGADEPLTREQTATILYRLFQQIMDPTARKSDFTDDGQVSDWAAESLWVLAGNGYISGYEDGTAGPGRQITRAEFIAILDHIVPNVVSDQVQPSYTGNVLVLGRNVDLTHSAIDGNVLLAKAAVQNPPKFAEGFTKIAIRIGVPKTAVTTVQTTETTSESAPETTTPSTGGSGGSGGGGGGGSSTAAVTFIGQYQVLRTNYVLLAVTSGNYANCSFAVDGAALTPSPVNTNGTLVKIEAPAGLGTGTLTVSQSGQTLLTRALSLDPGAAAPAMLYGEVPMSFSAFFHDITAGIDTVLPTATTFASGGTVAVPQKFITQGTRTGNNGTLTYVDGDKLEKVDAVSSATYGDSVHFPPNGNLELSTGPDGRTAVDPSNAITGITRVQVGVDFDLYANAKLLEASGRSTAQSANVAAKVDQPGFTILKEVYKDSTVIHPDGTATGDLPADVYAVKYLLTDGNWGKRVILNPAAAKDLPGTALETEDATYGGNWGDKVTGITHGTLQSEYAGANYWDNFGEYIYGGYIEDSAGHAEPLVFLQNLFSHRMHEDFDIALSPSRFARLGRLKSPDTYKVTVFAYGFKDVETEISFNDFINASSRIEGSTSITAAEGSAPVSFNVLDMDDVSGLDLSKAALLKGTQAVSGSQYQLTKEGQAVKVTLNASLLTGAFQGSYTLRLVPDTATVTSKALTFTLVKAISRPQLSVNGTGAYEATEAAPVTAAKGDKLYFSHDDFASSVIVSGRSGFSTIKLASADGAGTAVGDALARTEAGQPYYIDLGSDQFEPGNTYILTIYATAFEPQTYYVTVNGEEAIWLAELSNPFIGKWDFVSPDDGTSFEFEFDSKGFFKWADNPMYGPGAGSYVVFDNYMIIYSEFTYEGEIYGGAEGYTFEIKDNDTIIVTEGVFEEGDFVPSETAPFVRVAGSPVNREDVPFALEHPYVGTWRFDGDEEYPSLGLCHFVVDYHINPDGTFSLDGTIEDGGGNIYPMVMDGYYLVYDHIIVMYVEGEGFEAAAIEDIDSNTITVAEGDEAPVTLTRVIPSAQEGGRT
jgi:hypothetical protein